MCIFICALYNVHNICSWLCYNIHSIKSKSVFFLLSKLFEMNVFLLSPEKSINSIKSATQRDWFWYNTTLYRLRVRKAEENGEASGQRPYLGPHARLPHGHAVLALAALGRGRLGPRAVPFPGSGQGSIAQLLGTGHLSALYPFSTSSWTGGPFCHHPSKSKARVSETN